MKEWCAVPDLELAAAQQGQSVVVTVTGEVDLDNADQLERELGRALSQSSHLVVDLTDVPLCDSTGLNVLLKAHQQAERHGGSVVIAGPQSAVRKVLTITGLDAVLTSYASVDEAARTVSAE